MNDKNEQLRSALQELDQQSVQSRPTRTDRVLSASKLAAISANRNRCRNLAFTVLTVAATAILWNWQHRTNDPAGAPDAIASVPPVAASPALTDSINQFLEETRTLREETEQLLAKSRELTRRANWNDPIQDAATFAVGHANFRIDNGDDLGNVRQDLESVVQSYPNTFGAEEAKRILVRLSERPPLDASGLLPVQIDSNPIAKL